MKKKILVLLSLLGITIWVSPIIPIYAEEVAGVFPQSNFLEEGKKLFASGNFEQALVQWQKAKKNQNERHEDGSDFVLDMLQGEAYRRLGQYQEASKYFNNVLEEGRKTNDSIRVTQSLEKLGTMAFELGKRRKALDLLRKGLQLAREEGHLSLVAGLLNAIGNVWNSLNKNNAALGAYTEAAGLAEKTGNLELELIALINSAKAASQEGLLENSEARLDLALEKIASLRDGYGKVNGLLTVGILFGELDLPKKIITGGMSPAIKYMDPSSQRGNRGVEIIPGSGPQELAEMHVVPKYNFTLPLEQQTESGPRKSRRLRAFETLQQAQGIAHTIGDRRGESYALGHLGHLYERNGQYQEALHVTRQAVALSQKAVATEALFQWHWQTARILREQGERNGARQAYQRAIASLQPIRNEVSIAYQAKGAAFRDGVGQMYFELADLLLKEAKVVSSEELGSKYLREARNTIEGFKTAELQDYFQENCVEPSQTLTETLRTTSPKTAILYPILLKDRIELIANLPTGLRQYTVEISEQDVTKVARQFRRELQEFESQRFKQSARQLNTWLIEPLEQDLKEEDVQTLVFVPDGALRSIPIAALNDGKQYLIEKYAMAVTPGVTMTDPKPLNREGINVLSLGITESVQGFAALPSVGRELDTIRKIFKGKQLLNKNFVVKNMQEQLENKDYNIVHIASHGLVESNVEDTFVLAYDEKITMNRLAELVGLFRFRKAPLELLTLSACQTAAGDDRAALGLAGVAVKAGARSALATLWFIDDVVASDLVGEFYKQLKDSTLSKAKALQLAQMKILENPAYQHPNFWSPFLLINNWL